MKDKYKQNSQINSAIKNAEIFGDGNVTVGAPITVGNNVIIPVTKLTAVCLGGGGEYGKVNINYSDTSNISSVIINTKLVNNILNDAYSVIDEVFNNHLEEYFADLEIPLGTLVSKSIFSGMGPNIKIPITPVGSYKLDILTNTISYGINNSLIELYLKINVDIEALIPLQKEKFPTETKIIILSQVIQGEVPKYYYSSNGDASFPYIPDN
jgi:sporulation protein YunB